MDYARYIGIFLVVFGHSLQKFNWDECAFVKTLWDYIYLFQMPLFFIISGYLYESKAVNMTNIQFGGGQNCKYYFVSLCIISIRIFSISTICFSWFHGNFSYK